MWVVVASGVAVRRRGGRMGGKKRGLKVLRYGIEFHRDGRKRRRWWDGKTTFLRERWAGKTRPRGRIRAWSRESSRRLQLVMLNADAQFGSHVTLTYRARTETWELDEDRNRRMVRRSKEDLHRFLRCLRREGGDYVWVQEFQERGVIHYHVLFVEAVAQERAAVAWARASDQAHDEDVLRHGVKVDAVESDRGARGYLSGYVGKGRQKFLPPGVDNAGRWWGRSRSLRLMELEDVVSFDPKEPFMRTAEVRVLRAVGAYLTKVFSARAGKRRVFRGGAFVDFGGELAAKLQVMVKRLREYYGQSPESVTELMGQFGWEPVEGGAELMALPSWDPIQGGVCGWGWRS